MLNTIFLLCVFNPIAVDEFYSDIREITRSELNTAPAFVRVSESGEDKPNSVQYIIVATRQNVHSLRLVNYKVRDQAAVDRLWRDLMPSVASTLPPTGFSGLPIGTKVRRVEDERLISLNVADGLFVTKTMLVYAPLANQTADKDMVEGLTRRTLARCRGLQASAAAPMTIGQTSVGSITGSGGDRMVDLQRYAQALGLQLATNHVRGTATFSSGGEMVIIPLAAKKIKDGSRWIDTNDISVMKDGKWYVSYAALQEAREH
jgi:hypothetical protein